MKRFIRILVPVCLVLAIAVCVAFSALASEYTGSVDELNSMVETAESASGKEVDASLVAIADYLAASPIEPGAEGFDAAMDRVYAVGIARVNEYVAAIEAAASTDEKDEILDAIAPLSVLFDIPEGTAGYAECVVGYGTVAMSRAQELVAAVDPTLGTARNGIAVRRLNAFIKKHVVLELMGDEYEQLVADAEEATTAHDQAMADNFATLASNVAISEYDYGILMDNDYSDASDPEKLYGFTQRLNLSGENTAEVTSGLDGDNSYFLFSYNVAGHSYIRTDLPKYEVGTVIEFDITTFDRLPEAGIEIASSSATTEDGERYYPGYANILNTGRLISKSGQTLMDNVITVGEWTHISMVFHQATGLIDYYVDYEYLGSYDGTAGHAGVHNMHCFRIGSVNTNDVDDEYDGGFAVDNFKIYQGSSVRQLDYISSMTDEERFAFYCDYLAANEDDIVGLKIAYDYATSKIKDYVVGGIYTEYFLGLDEAVKAEVQEAVAIYNEFDYEPIYVAYTKDNLEMLIDYADAIEAHGRGVATINNRKASYDTYNSFLNTYEKDIYTGDGRFNETKSRVAVLVNQITADENISTFIKFVDRFYRAFNAKAMESHYNICTQMWQSISITDRELMNSDLYADFKEAYERYLGADEILAGAKLEKVSKQIIECVAFIKDYDTLEEWQANQAYINKYLVLIRDFLREESDGTLKYDPNYEGIDEAIAIYEPINDYFFGLMQNVHIEIFEEQLEKYAATDAYIEKMGICAYLRTYIKENEFDIDMENSDIKGCIGRLDIYESELLKCKEDYAELLEYNTEAFAATVKKMQAADGYAEIKAYYDEAVLYYYAMNVGDSAIAEQLAAFDGASIMLEEIKAASEAFLLGITEYTLAENEDDKFVALTVCYKNSLLASTDIDGVAEVKAEFEEIYSAYLASIGVANDEVSAVFGTVAAQRANTAIAPVAEVVAGIVTGR
ncbi:MAG: hypothetical protein IJX38_05380 [Clostridia bacterium]|nr:hypothetical protein [Clostridia bacterium]